MSLITALEGRILNVAETEKFRRDERMMGKSFGSTLLVNILAHAKISPNFWY